VQEAQVVVVVMEAHLSKDMPPNTWASTTSAPPAFILDDDSDGLGDVQHLEKDENEEEEDTMQVLDEDEVVKVIDVFLSQEAASQLHLVQYPLRPTWRPYDRKNISAVRHKKQARKLEVDFALTEEEIADHYDSQVEDDRPKTFTLTSAPVSPQANYALALLRSGPERAHGTPATT